MRSALAVLIALTSTQTLSAQRAPNTARDTVRTAIRYPSARTVNVVDNYFGTRVADPYRWFEDDTPETRRWARTQTAFAAPYLRDKALSPWIRRRLSEYMKVFDDLEAGNSAFESIRLDKIAGGSRSALVAQRDSTSAKRVLLDPITHGPLARITRFRVSRDQQHAIVELADGGSDWHRVRVVRISDGVLLPDRIDGTLFAQPVWTRDSKGFFYARYERPSRADHVMFKNATLLYHSIGTAASTDRVIWQSAQGNSETVLNVSLSSDGRYAIFSEGTGADSDEIGWLDSRLHVLDLGDANAPKFTSRPVALTSTSDAAYRVIRTNQTTFTILTDHGAPRHRLVTVDLANPTPDRWRDLIPEAADVLQSVRVINNRLVAIYLRDAQPYVRVFSMDGKPLRDIQPPAMSRIWTEPGAADSLLEIESEGFLQTPTVVQYDLTTGVATTLQKTRTSFPFGDFVQSQRWFVSKDGTRIPIFLVHRKDIVLDGSHPALMYGYGASGTSMLPMLAPDALAWLELGGVYAMPSLRGGGEFGRSWYTSAILDKKQNTFDDFIAAAEFLVAERYTSPSRLAIKGESNGGLLVAAAMTQRPDLFAVAVAGVPQTDNLRYDRGRHRAQFGTAHDSTQFPFLFAYSPLHRVRKGTCYPATLINTALNDDRSAPWSAMKFTASLQAAQSCGRPVVLQAHVSGGHYGVRGPESVINESTEVLTFVASQLGMRVPPTR